MRPWLLLVSLFVSDLSPPGDGDWVMENSSWSLYREWLLNGQMTPKGLERLQSRTGHHYICIRRNCVYVAVQHKQRTCPFYWAYTICDDHRCSLSHREFTGIIHGNHIPALVVSVLHGEGKTVPAIQAKSDALPALHVISKITPTKAGGGTSHIAMGVIKDHPVSGSAWLLHHHTAASGRNFQAFSLKKSKSWAPATIVQRQKMLTKGCCAATTVTMPCCLRKGDIRSALKLKKIFKQHMAQARIRQKGRTQGAMGIKALTGYDGQPSPKAAVSQHDIFQAATLHSGSSSVKTSDTSQLQIQTNALRITKKNGHLNLDEKSPFQKNIQRQQSLKAASSVHEDDDDDRFYLKRKFLLVPGERTESINRPQYKMRAAQDGNKEDFRGKIITKQTAFRRPEGEIGTEQSHSNTIENVNHKRLAYIQQADFTYKTDEDDVERKQMLTRVGEEVLIMLFPPDPERETQTKPLSQTKVILNTDTGWKTVNIKELDDPPPVIKVIKENFFIEPGTSKCKYLQYKLYALDRAERADIKPAQRAVKVTPVSPYTGDQVKETVGKIKHTETKETPHEDLNINHTKQEENVPSEEPVIPSPPSLNMMENETAKTEHSAETTAVHREIKETTSSAEAFIQSSTQKAGRLPSTDETLTTTVSPESETAAEPRFIRCKTGDTRAPTKNPFSGLRMRENILADSTRLHEGTKNKERAATNRPGNEGEEDQNDPEANSFTFPKPPRIIQAVDKLPETAGDNMPPCRGLIHRTEAGWKHCVERYAGVGSKMFSPREPTDAFKDAGEQGHTTTGEHKDGLLHDDEYDHFYYFDGVLRRVRNNYYPRYKRRRWHKRSHDNTEDSGLAAREKEDTHENLLSYIRRLKLRNEAGHFKRSGNEDDVQKGTG